MDEINALRRYDAFRAGRVTEAIVEGANLHHTCHMIGYAERKISDSEKKDGLLMVLGELELVYKENQEKILKPLYNPIESALFCAREDVDRGEYWAAIMDVYEIEHRLLQEYIPKLPNLDKQTYAPLLMAQKILKAEGIPFSIETNKVKHEEDSADWWKK